MTSVLRPDASARRTTMPILVAITRMFVVAVALVAALSVIALPALAIYDSGSISCGGNYIAVRSHAVGTVKHFVPSSTVVKTWSNPTWMDRTNATQVSNSTWKADGSIGLSEPTYAFCYGV